ncbi:MMPL family transporter [Pyrobaculum islandicum]|uniref:MMPL family transporter n=1 Tax=Pyrobaculum islandicum TaxID=2277 RepID=UPI00069E934C|nr:MMPL family transporter [Pyrobaculum islandicum]
MNKTVVAALVLLAVYIYLASHASRVFDILIYDESKLMPPDIEPKKVESIIGAGDRGKAVPVVIWGPHIEEKARNLTRLYPNAITAWTILDAAMKIYRERIDAAVDNATMRFREAALLISNSTRDMCNKLESLERVYVETKEAARRLILATYGVAASGRAFDNKTKKFLEAYARYAAIYDVDTAVRRAADEAYGNVSMYLTNVTWKTWASERAVENVTYAILGSKLNSTALEIAQVVATVGVRQYVYLLVLNKTPPILRPYLPQLVCGGDVERAVSMFREELIRNLTAHFPPPTIYTIEAAAKLVCQGRYALAIVETNQTPSVPRELGVPVSSALLLKSFTNVVTEDVSKIDRATAASLFVVLLYVMGTLLTPALIVSAVGLTYLAVLGFFYQIHGIQKIYYITVYMAAPVVFAIGVDYMLLMASRYAEERALGKEKDEAIASVRRYANRAIAASAAVVATSLGSFALSRMPFMQTIGIGYLITTAFVVATVFLIFPALLYLLGDRIFWPKKTVSHVGRSRIMEKAVVAALRRPFLVVALAAFATALSALYLATSLKITTNPVVAMPETEYKRALEIATTYFPNVTAISTTYIAMKDPPPPGLLQEVEKLPHYVNYTVEKRGEWYIVSIKLSVEDTSDALLEIYHRLDELRQRYGPYLIGGSASWKNVIFSEIYVRFWSFQVYVVVVAAFMVLALLLRSFIIPLRLIATVLMSIAWSLAAEVALFQDLMAQPTYWLVPIILFSFLMAVGTDYDIFIVTRIREELEQGYDEREAIRRAVVTTGPIITGAAIILATAFSTLALSQILLLKQVGFTIALAALIDAFVVRPFVVPALMVLAGRYNWLWIGGYSVAYHRVEP